MGQLSLFSRAETAAMRDRTKARNYDPERDEFRRQQRFRRDWGLQRRHAEKLRRLRESGAVSRPPSVRASGQVRPVTCASRPTHRGPASRQAAPAKEVARPSAARPSAPRLPVTRPSAPRPSAARPSAPRPLEVPVSPRATLPSGGSRPPLPVLPAWDRPVLAGLRKAGPSPHAADSSAPSSAGIWPPSSGSFTLVIIAESCKITGVGRRPSESRELHSNVSATGRSNACIVADISESKTLGQLTQNCECADRDVSRRLWNRAGPPFWFGADPPERGRWIRSVHGHGSATRPVRGHGATPSRCTWTWADALTPTRTQGRCPTDTADAITQTRADAVTGRGLPTDTGRQIRTGASPRTRADAVTGRRLPTDTGRRGHRPTPPHGHEPTDTDRRLPTDTSRRTRTGASPRTRACALALHTDRARHLHRDGWAPSTDTGRRPHPDTGRRGHGPTPSPSTETPASALTFGDRWRPPKPTGQSGSIDLADQNREHRSRYGPGR
jgi:hypothetical protein